MFENIRLAFQGIWSHKMRSFLTMLGIIIGIAAIIAIVSTMKGTNEQIKKNLIGTGNNTVEVPLSQGGDPYYIYDAYSIPKGIPQVSDATKRAILDLPEVEAVTIYNNRYVNDGIFYQNSSLSDVQMYGIDRDYFETCNLAIRSGRGFLERDFTSFAKVIILDEKCAKSLFESESPLGKTLEIMEQPFTVVGVVTQRSKYQPVINSLDDYYNFNTETTGKVFIPNTTWPVIYNYDEPQNVTVKARSTDDMTRAGRLTAEILNKTISGGSGSDNIKYSPQDLLQRATQLQQMDSSSRLQMLLIAGISLLVGGIGVMNIMLVSVTERISEIGLKKAIGARRGLIMAQFLTEAAVLTSLGGIIGVGAGIGTAWLIHYFNDIPVGIDVGASIAAVVFSMAIGIFFGFVPSVKASDLDPIEALRRE